METDSIIKEIDKLHQKADSALENKDVASYLANFDSVLNYKSTDGQTIDKTEYAAGMERYFRNVKKFRTSYYRIKSALEGEMFTEKIARKSVVKTSAYLILSKKQTIQTEEICHWQKIDGMWKITNIELVLEEKY